jgi:hypothetical protein
MNSLVKDLLGYIINKSVNDTTDDEIKNHLMVFAELENEHIAATKCLKK